MKLLDFEIELLDMESLNVEYLINVKEEIMKSKVQVLKSELTNVFKYVMEFEREIDIQAKRSINMNESNHWLFGGMNKQNNHVQIFPDFTYIINQIDGVIVMIEEALYQFESKWVLQKFKHLLHLLVDLSNDYKKASDFYQMWLPFIINAFQNSTKNIHLIFQKLVGIFEHHYQIEMIRYEFEKYMPYRSNNRSKGLEKDLPKIRGFNGFSTPFHTITKFTRITGAKNVPLIFQGRGINREYPNLIK